MKAGKLIVAALVLISAVIWLAGCGKDNPVSSSTPQLPSIVSVSPPDGATGIPTSATVSIQFDMPMNTESVMADSYLAGGDEMHAWMDSLTHHNGSGGGSMMDMDEMMEWMHRIAMPGEYHWNGAHDFCEFVADNGLMPDTDYMIFIGAGMRSHSGGSMHTHDPRYDGYMFHFRTAP